MVFAHYNTDSQQGYPVPSLSNSHMINCSNERVLQISIRFDEAGLPGNNNSSIDILLKGHAGQSFCAFLAKGVSVTLEGDANDYVGKVRQKIS